MTLIARLSAFVSAVGADIKALYAQRGRPPTVASFSALPSSVTEPTLYCVATDETNNNQISLYLLSGTTKLWIPASAV